MAGTKGEEKEISRDHILQISIPDEEFRYSFDGTGEPWQVWGTRRAGTVLCFRLRVAGRERGKTGEGDQGGCWGRADTGCEGALGQGQVCGREREEVKNLKVI